MTRIPLFILGLALSMAAGSVIAQTPDVPVSGQQSNSERLTPQQRVQVRQIMEQQRAETQQKLSTVLTPQQMAAWQAREAEHKARHENHKNRMMEHHQGMPVPDNDPPAASTSGN